MIIEWNGLGRRDAAETGPATLRAYWEALRVGKTLPQRAQIDPRGLATTLHQMMIAEEIAPGLARLRIAGALYADTMGMDVRGMPLSALFDTTARPALERVLQDVFAGHTAATLLLEAERGLGRPALQGQLMLLPLADDGPTQMMIGCLALRGNAGRTPRRFNILHVTREALQTAAVSRHAPARAEPPVPFRRAGPQTVHLRLVKS
jgi:hypothetical protein